MCIAQPKAMRSCVHSPVLLPAGHPYETRLPNVRPLAPLARARSAWPPFPPPPPPPGAAPPEYLHKAVKDNGLNSSVGL